MKLEPIGHIITPYEDNAPYQPITQDTGDFKIVLNERYTDGLDGLEKFRYIFVLYHLHKISSQESPTVNLTVRPPWAKSHDVGIFASRTPHRPNPIGLSIVELKRIEKNVIYTSGLDALNGSPVLDIKPYILELDSKGDANYGWLDFKDKEDREHLLLHIKGLPH
ncbi:MAG: tRNA (N6-threonylcarbamoyladenosine(37)-N6)-methyltransferase TrmO [Promethearchaeota archaeon]